MEKKKRILVSAILVLLVLALTGEAFGQDRINIRIGSPFRTGHILVDAAERFKTILERESGGRFAVELRVGTLSEEAINDLCHRGEIEMQSNGHRALEIYAPQYFFFNAPYVMRDFDHFMRVWNGPLGRKAIETVEKNGNITYMSIVYRGLRQTTSRRPIYTPADTYGLKLRLPTVKTWIAVWKAMDTEPIPIPLPELYRSLKEGKAEASEGDLGQIVSFRLDEVQTHLTLTNHLVMTGGMMVNRGFFTGLSPADQELVRRAVREATDWANDRMRRTETALLIDLQRKGMAVVVPDAELFRQKAKPVIEELFAKEWNVTTWPEVLAQ
jgi:TRAP-type C4-dicarboxylate transport system substrate-binding protein